MEIRKERQMKMLLKFFWKGIDIGMRSNFKKITALWDNV